MRIAAGGSTDGQQEPRAAGYDIGRGAADGSMPHASLFPAPTRLDTPDVGTMLLAGLARRIAFRRAEWRPNRRTRRTSPRNTTP